MRRGKLAVFDLDDTLLLTGTVLFRAAEDVTKKKLTREQIKKLPPEMRLKIFKYAIKNYRSKYRVNKAVFERYRRCVSNGYDIIIISSRWNDTRKYTKEILDKEKIKFKKLILSGRKWHSGLIFKRYYLNKLLKSYDEILFFDDSRKIIKSISGSRQFRRISTYLVSGKKIINAGNHAEAKCE